MIIFLWFIQNIFRSTRTLKIQNSKFKIRKINLSLYITTNIVNGLNKASRNEPMTYIEESNFMRDLRLFVDAGLIWPNLIEIMKNRDLLMELYSEIAVFSMTDLTQFWANRGGSNGK